MVQLPAADCMRFDKQREKRGKMSGWSQTGASNITDDTPHLDLTGMSWLPGCSYNLTLPVSSPLCFACLEPRGLNMNNELWLLMASAQEPLYTARVPYQILSQHEFSEHCSSS